MTSYDIKVNTIAIDGPAASGKSTLGEALALHLKFLYFDTGILYRAITQSALENNIPIDDDQACTQLAKNVTIELVPPTKDDGRMCDVLIDGKDRTWAIREPEVDASVSVVAAYSGVRDALADQQRRIGMRGEVVMVGRDIGTVVIPEAFIKIFLVASVENRARRRYEELIARDEEAEYNEILEALRLRDSIDANRTVAPLRAADDAVVVNSDEKNAAQILEMVKAIVVEKNL